MKKAMACGKEVIVIETYYNTRALDTITICECVKTKERFAVKASLVKYVSEDPNDPFTD